MEAQPRGSVVGGALIVAGTCIGGGMLALPVATAACGFVPALAVFLVCWLFMACTGLLMAEVCLWMGKETNIISMADRSLGAWAKYLSWALYLFLFYSLTLAYVTECGNLVAGLVEDTIPEWLGTFIFIACFAPLVYLGAAYVDRINKPFMLGLGLTYLAFIWLGWSHVDPDRLEHHNWALTCTVLPLSFTAFAYQGTVPTLCNYLGRDALRIRKAILVGSFLPFICYAIWEWLILGIVPQEELVKAMQADKTAIYPLKSILDTADVLFVAEFFAFFALVTSFLGVTLGLRDFLADGLQVKKTPKGKLLLCLLIFVPPLAISKINPHIFLSALQYAGALGCALLLGLLPILMTWKLRYRDGAVIPGRLGGGRGVLLVLLAIVILELTCQIGNTLAWW